MTLAESLVVLRERAAYLQQRIVAKQAVRWDWKYDERECAALTVAIEELAKLDGLDGPA